MHYLLIYDLADDYLERRGPLRADLSFLAPGANAQPWSPESEHRGSEQGAPATE